jgi:hypothetical protein
VPEPLFSPRGSTGNNPVPSEFNGLEEFPSFDDDTFANDEPKDFFLDWKFQESRFSAWSIEDDILADYAEFSSSYASADEEGADQEELESKDDSYFYSHDGNGDNGSLTYSSLPTSGTTSPLSFEESRLGMFDNLDWLASSPATSPVSDGQNAEVGGEPDASAKTVRYKSDDVDNQVTTLEELIDEFNYLGSAVL